MENIFLYKNDLPKGVKFKGTVAVDTEFTSLDLNKTKLCVVQISSGDGNAHIVQLKAPYKCANLKKLLSSKRVEKIFHYARADMGVVKKNLGIDIENVFCTKIASKLIRRDTDRHSLRHLTKDLVGITLNKEQQLSDWTVDELSDKQLEYAASDVLYLHKIKDILVAEMKKQKMMDAYKACMAFLPVRVQLDIKGEGLEEIDIFSHH